MYRYYPCKIPEWQAAVELAALDIPRLWCERERLPRKGLGALAAGGALEHGEPPTPRAKTKTVHLRS